MIIAIRTARVLLALLLLFAPACPAPAAEPKIKIVAFGLFGDQDVFESEAKGAAQIMAGRFGGAPTVVRFNSKTREDATPESLAASLQATAMGMDAERDVLIVILTSHGSPAGVAVKTPGRAAILAPLDLFTMLDAAHVRHRVVIVSACYSGVFVAPLADPDTLVITAADAGHTSFGCRNGAQWTYFGDAFFNVALRHSANLHEAFAQASSAIRKRETQEHDIPSNPQIGGGENVERILAGGPQSRSPAPPDARYAPALAARAEAFSDKNNYDRAIAAYGDAIRLDPKYAGAFAGRSTVYRLKGDLNHAIADGIEAVRLDPKLTATYFSRGSAYASKGDFDHAIADFDEAIRLDPKQFVAYNNRGYAYRGKGDLDGAIADFSAVIRLAPQFFPAYDNRGLAYAAQGDYDRAIADFDQAIKLNPKYTSAYNNRGLVYRAKGDTVHADADLKEAARLKASAAQ